MNEIKKKKGKYYSAEYWRDRFDLIYYQAIDFIVRSVGYDAKSIIDVGSGNCPYIEWFYWIDRKVSIDIRAPYSSPIVESVVANILDHKFEEKFDVALCLQVLEHISDPGPFARRLLELSDRLIVSVPYKWPAGKTPGHVQDPVDEAMLQSWFGRSPNYSVIINEPLRGAKGRRLIAIFDADVTRRFGHEDTKRRMPKLDLSTERS